MKLLGSLFLLVAIAAPSFAIAGAAEPIRIELNLAENVQGKMPPFVRDRKQGRGGHR